MARSVFSGSLFRGQVDFYFPFGSPNRVTGLNISNISYKLFFNNSPLLWALSDGTSVADSSISSGLVYFNEIPGEPGYYSYRLFPDKIGYWRIVFASSLSSNEYVCDFDTIGQSNSSSGLNASFS